MVSKHLRVSYRGSDYDVSTVPGVGEKLLICANPWARDTVQVVMSDGAGHEACQVVQRVTYDQFGMVADAPVLGESYARHADTPAQTKAKALGLMATGTSTETEAKAARRADTVALGGQIDPFTHIDQALEHVPATMPRRSRDSTWSLRRGNCRRFRSPASARSMYDPAAPHHAIRGRARLYTQNVPTWPGGLRSTPDFFSRCTLS
ncbi:hypothetical protein [Achromobacter sp. DH1f]|uniref:hypothetical protein n=1 Tax=Achromobacter sp. DH1f TaxID=1397275 RepID=UPI0012FE982E|nr:hypothetical protein [Achromobacter sp. DH1f]